MASKLDVTKHILVPKHEKLNDKQKKELFELYRITSAELPKISAKDPAINGISPKEGDVIRVTRQSPTAGEIVFYRCVINA